jgi:hypothetical protein
MVQRVLRVVPTPASAIEPPAATAPHKSAGEEVFDHWVFMLAKNPRRCAFGPTRRRAVDKALALYDLETLLLAIEGCAASPWHAGANDRDRAFDDLELILRDEAHIERFAADGERLRERAAAALEERARREAQAQQQHEATPSAEDVAAQRERLRKMAALMAGRCR